MKIEQIYTGCLAQGAYYIESNGEVAIIDPLREVQPYIDKATNAIANIIFLAFPVYIQTGGETRLASRLERQDTTIAKYVANNPL